MNLKLICDKIVYELIELKLKPHNVRFSDSPDVYVVQKGYECLHYPQIIFEADDTDTIVHMITSLYASSYPKISDNKIVVYKDEEYYMVSLEKVLYFEAYEASVYCHTADDRFLTKDKLYVLEESLPNNNFIRTSKSFIININNVSKIIPWFSRRLLIKFSNSSKEAEVSKNYSKKFKDFLGIR